MRIPRVIKGDSSWKASSNTRNIAIVIACGSVDGLLLIAILAHAIPAPFGFGLHMVAVLMASSAIISSAHDTTFGLLAGLAMMFAGPVGGLVAIIQMLVLRLTSHSGAVNQAWMRTLTGASETDPAEALYEAIEHGRSFRPGPAPRGYAKIMAEGTVVERQKVLGQIARRKRNYPLALLQAGLTSPDLAVRASAAAVYANLRAREADAKAALSSREQQP